MDNSPPPGEPYLRMHAVNIYVRDQERSLRFYLDRLGFDLAFDAVFNPANVWWRLPLPMAKPSWR